MSTPPEAPLALIGYSPAAARALRTAGLIVVGVPDENLGAVMQACRTLRFSGALVHESREGMAAGAADPDASARRVGRVDAVAFTAGGAQGTYALADALTDAVEASGYAARGAGALLLGSGGELARALPLVRLGFTTVGIAADSVPDAERFVRDLPAGVRAFPVSRFDPALASLAERADLIVLTGGTLPPGLLQPYHTLADLTGRANSGASGAATLDLSLLPALRLSRQLLHATGQRYRPEDLTELAGALV
ncbi:shikimate dehydrogenase [Deinococcus planocerae]|uniref:shikimate dehydrogenase n=1 Tax=Deinococcus planocerae TaxID=1737569 RepID=UPI000C7ED00B|nr:shikimate dehydrogenase [Deinococcus planocerae]